MKENKGLSGILRQSVRGNVFLLGLTSFFTDLSSEMIYPLLPVFFSGLVSPAAAPVYIGLMDGIAESASSLLKILSGRLSDITGKRKLPALAGYSISSLARPLTALATAGWHVVLVRFIDRIGKGVRTSPRDALLSESVGSDSRGLAFSFQRLMDHAGAVGGPLFAAAFLYAVLGHGNLWRQEGELPGHEEMQALRWLFGIAVVPGILAVAVLWLFVRETPQKSEDRQGTEEAHGDGRALPATFHMFLGAVVLFTLGNSSDLFLIYYAETRFGLGPGWMIALWILLHFSKILFSLPGGRFSDRMGRRPAIVIGWLIYIAVYIAMPFTGSFPAVVGLLFLYGAYYGMTEGAERAIVADIVPAAVRGRAYGLYHGAVGIAALPASLVFGVLWSAIGAKGAFLTGASFAAVAVILLTGFLGMNTKREQPAGS